LINDNYFVLYSSLLREYEAIESAASADTEAYVGNPLNSYRLIKKMTSDWKELKDIITDNAGENLVANLTSQRQARNSISKS
jgi:prolyl 4-hydroxylase